MKYLIAILAVGAMLLAATNDSFAQKGGKGGYGYAPIYQGYGYGYPQAYGHGHQRHQGYGHHYGHGGYGHGYGGNGYGAPYGNGHFHQPQNLGQVPYMPSPAYNAGPPTPTVTYPYYTTRGPRDFLLANPPSIGP